MSKRLTIRDVADYVGVSSATISYYLNGRYENMSEEMRQRIEDAVEKLDYHPSSLARNLRVQKTKTIGLVVAGMQGNIGFQGVNGVCEYLNKRNYDTMVFMTNNDPKKEREYLQRCVSNCCDGIIVQPTAKENYGLMRQIHRAGIPVVLQSRCDSAIWPYDASMLDYRCVGNMMKYLKEQGFTKVAFLADIEKAHLETFSTNKKLRIGAFLEASQELFHDSGDSLVYYGVRTDVQLRTAVEDFVHRFPEDKKVVFAVNSPMLLLAYRTLCNGSTASRMEVELCGYGGPDWVDIMTPRPITLTQPLKMVGSNAAELMLWRLENSDAERKIVFAKSHVVDANGNIVG